MNMKKFLATAITVCCCAGAAVVPALAADPTEAAVHEEYQGNVSDAAQPEPGEGEEQTPEEEYRIELPENEDFDFGRVSAECESGSRGRSDAGTEI